IDNGLSFYCFPAWKQNEGSHVSAVTKSLKVCSRHFHPGKPAYEMDESHPDWAPTLHLGHSEVTATVSDRHGRRQHRHHLRESEGGGQNEQNNMNEDERDGPFLPVAKKLSQFQMVLLTLIRLRLDLPIQHLSHIFNVSRRTLSATFADTIHVLYARLTPLLYWPERHCLQATMPHQFLEAFGKRVAIIVDCVEIRTERPSNLMARAQSFSHYKGTHTMKYLIGITPQGQISFISKGWGGRASDKHITENCGLLNKLLPGDLVLADRGFNIKDSVGMMCAEVKIPAFTKSRCQLDAKDVEDTRAIAHLRIHVERVIGSLRNKYTLLHNTIPISLLLPCKDEELTLLDKIVNVQVLL
uniref:THAP-type domain-containing protein n=1 Tax=Sander lucioperca TaxID=283035 RepID=A0A8C9ZFR5_SANLU